MALLTVVLLLGPSTAEGARVSIAVGANAGLGDEEPLRYANDDARRVDAAMRDVGGVANENAFLVVGASRAQVLLVIARAAARLKGSAEVGELFFYYSGHGNEQELHLGGERLRLDELSERIKRVGARLTIVVLDACRTSLAAKGVRAIEPPVAITTRVRASGFVELRAAAEGEPAQESHELGGAVFTHYWTSGLRGAADVDRDGMVTLDEVYRFAHGRTVARTATAAMVQRPTWDAQLSVEGALPLAHLAGRDTTLMARAADYLVFTLPARAPVGELGPGQAIAVARGRYLVVRRSNGQRGAAELDLARGGAVALDEVEYQPISSEVLASRGEVALGRRRYLLFSAVAALSPGTAASVGGGGALELAWRLGDWLVGIRGRYVAAPLLLTNGSGVEHQATGALTAGYLLHDGAFSVALRASIGADVMVDTLAHADADALARLGIEARHTLWGGGGSLRGGAWLGVALGAHWHLLLEAEAGALLVPQREGLSGQAQLRARPVFSIGAGAAYVF